VPTQKFALERGQRERLTVCWRGSWKRLTVWLDGREVGTVPDARALREGQSFSLDDGTTLCVQLVQSFITPELRLLRDGRPLPRSAFDPVERLHVAYATLFLIAGLHLAFGVAAEAFQDAYFRSLGIGPGALLIGVVYLILGFFARKRSARALTAAIVLYLLEVVTAGAVGIYLTGRFPVAGLIVPSFLCLSMHRGLPAIRDLNRLEDC